MQQVHFDTTILRVKARLHRDEARLARDPTRQRMHADVAGEYDRLADEVEAPRATRH